ncbi:MAG: glycosyltransferase [Caldilinea sp. CFX5]|nr:glycosyltransferase [Caldilinea sp. CFX5]
MTTTVLHLITELDSGGAQSALLRLVAGQDRSRFKPVVLCLYNGDRLVARQIRSLGVEVIDLGMSRKWRLDAFWRLWQQLRRVRPAILHTWMFHANIPGRLLGRLAGVPHIISSERTMGQEGSVRRLLNRWTGRLADRIICVSQNVADFAAKEIGLPTDRLVVIQNGIDTNVFRPALVQTPRSPEQLTIGYVGRLEKVKGVNFLIDAFARLVAAYPHLQLQLVGDGSERPALEQQVQTLGLGDKVQFLGIRSDMPALYPTFDLFVLPSLWEGMPNVALEAMACGVPVIATNTGGTPEVVHDGKSGLLAPPGDAATLAKVMVALIGDAERRDQLAQAGRHFVEQTFSINQTIAQTVALYEQVQTVRQ